MSDVGDESTADLRELQQLAQKRGDYAWRQLAKYGWLDNALFWLAGLTAGGAGVSAVLEAPSAVTAIVAFASAALTAIAAPVRAKRVYAVRAAADYQQIAWQC